MTDLREYVLETVTHALAIELPGEPEDDLKARAEGLIAIAEANNMRIESLLRWIHLTAHEKEWSLAEFRRFCDLFSTREQSNG